MKNKMKFIRILVTIFLCFTFTNNAVAQKKKNKVKSHVKQNHKKHFRPKKAKHIAHHRHYRHLPKRGKVIRKLHVGAVRIGFRGTHFHFHNGVWYRPHRKQFIVARAPFGIRVRVLPVGHRRIVIGSRPYFYYYGTYYVKVENSDEYEVIAAPIGAAVDALPDGYKVVKANNMSYYQLDDVYYEPRINEESKEYYVVVKNPTE